MAAEFSDPAKYDAETLAAWADHGLSAEATAAVELHLSQCDRCQDVLAAFARSAPVTAAVIPFWSRRPVQWTTGALAVAAAVLLMVLSAASGASPLPSCGSVSLEGPETMYIMSNILLMAILLLKFPRSPADPLFAHNGRGGNHVPC